MKRALPFLLAMVLCIAIFAPFSVHAQWFEGQGIVPQAQMGEYQLCDLVHLAQNIIQFGVFAAVLVAALMFAYAGVLYVTAAADQGQIKKAHGIFGSVFVGLLFVLGAWLIVDTVMQVLAGGKPFGNAPWNAIECVAQPQYASTGIDTVLPYSTAGEQSNTQYGVCQGECVGLSVPNVSSSCAKTPTGSCWVTKETNDAASNFYNSYGKDNGMVVTAAIGGTHKALCQNSGNSQSGTCFDAVSSNMSDPNKVQEYVRSSEIYGFRSVFETPDISTYNAIKASKPDLVSSGSVLYCDGVDIKCSGSHYSMYLANKNPKP